MVIDKIIKRHMRRRNHEEGKTVVYHFEPCSTIFIFYPRHYVGDMRRTLPRCAASVRDGKRQGRIHMILPTTDTCALVCRC